MKAAFFLTTLFEEELVFKKLRILILHFYSCL